ncbi:MAG: hypothetical protein LAT56_00395 [Wenzhouxiangella sp.]|nr:hypothetical protein [Wenzhouxiangella sp.]
MDKGYIEEKIKHISHLMQTTLDLAEERERELEARLCRYAEEAMHWRSKYYSLIGDVDGGEEYGVTEDKSHSNQQ